MLSYNVSNLESSLNYGNFITYLNNFDIFFLFETHVLPNKQTYLSSYLQNYYLQWQDATKVNRFGRASGGCLFGFKKEIKKKYKLNFIVSDSQYTMLSASLDGNIFYFIPTYLNCTRWKVDVERFGSFLEDLNPTNFCIMGDMNARIGEEQVLDYNIVKDCPHISYSRRSKDRNVNTQGRNLLRIVDDIGGIIINGRTLEDIDGEFTFCGAMGSSVIDYCISSASFLSYIDKFKVATEPFSDHMPLCLDIKIPKSSTETTQQPIQKLHWDERHRSQYNHNLSLLAEPVNDCVFLSSEDLVENIKNKIRRAQVKKTNRTFFEPKQKWFDWTCFRLRSNMHKNLKIYRKSHTVINRRRYYSSRSKFHRMCNEKKLQYFNGNLRELDTVSCSKDWWNLANSLNKRNVKGRGNLDADDFLAHFNSLLVNEDNSKIISWCIPFHVDPLLDSPFEFCELLSVLKGLKSNKAPGNDGIPYEFYKFAPRRFLQEILVVFNKIFLHENVPTSFKKSILIPLFKKGDINLASNYRGLSLLDTIGKIFNSVLLNRITFWLTRHDVLNEFQAGFRREYSTIDNIFNLVNIVSLNQLQGKITYAFFVDFSSAFDLIPRNSLFYKLSSQGLSTKLVTILRMLYDGTESRVWDGSTFSEYFPVESGVKQGCILSPVLFSLYVNDLPYILPGGVRVADTTVKVLLYADDIVLLSDSPLGLQEMIYELERYCLLWSLKVNLSKSKILVFRRGSRISSNLRWCFGNQNIEIVNSYTYLGVEITYNLSFRKHLQKKLADSKLAINSTWSKYISHPSIAKTNKMKIFDACSRSIMFYAAQVWGYTRFDDVEKLFRFFTKKMLYLPNNTPNYMLYLETGFSSMFCNTLRIHFNYINRILRLSSHRLPRLLAEKIIELNALWAKEWSNICQTLQYIPANATNPICMYSDKIVELLRIQEQREFESDARNSQFHDLYSVLEYNIIPFHTADLSSRATSLIIKARGGLLDLNSRSFRSNTHGTCSMCNTDQDENTLHFIGACPLYREFRKSYFGKYSLNESEVLNILNGTNNSSLYKYIENCTKYRKLIINEFSF